MEKNLSVIESFESLEKKANFLAKSGVIPVSLRNKPADVLAVILMGQELGIGPMQALNGIDCIQGRPTISPQLMIALIRRDCPGAYIEVSEKNLVAKCVMARSQSEADMKQAFTAIWDMNRVTKMGLAGKDNYHKQPGTMLMWRAVGEAARKVFPDIIKGLYFPDEMINGEEKIVTNEDGEKVDIDISLVTKEDLRALKSFMNERGFTAEQLKRICLEQFKTADSTRLNKHQLKKLIDILNVNNPEDFEELKE